MIFVIGDLKYDTDKMTVVSDLTKEFVESNGLELSWARYLNSDPEGKYGKYISSTIYKGKNGNYLETYEKDYKIIAKAICEKEVKEKLKRYDYKKYEELFGQLEEA